MRTSRPALAGLALAAALWLPGCGGGGNAVWVTGKLLKGGSAYVPPTGQTVNVTFVVMDAKDGAGKPVAGGEPFWAEVDQTTGTFTVPGQDGRGIPPGKYRIAVTQKLTREAFDAANKSRKRAVDRDADTLADKFGPGTSPIVRELVKPGEVVIDLDKPA